jgi:hypothetical protein
MLTVAMPVASVKAVAAAGVIVASVASVLKVTTVLGTTAPVASFTVAFTVAGAPVEMEFTVAPAALVRANVIVAAAAVVPSVPVVPPDPVAPGVPDEVGVPPAPPDPQPASKTSAVARKNAAENREISALSDLWVTKKLFCTKASRLRNPNRFNATHRTVQHFYYKHNKLNQIFNVE